MPKSKNLKIFAAALCAVLCFALSAAAFQPEEALSPRPEKSVYSVVRVNNIGDFLRWIASEQNLKLVAPLAELEDDEIAMILATLEKIPAEAVALLVGADSTGDPFVQIAAAMPKSLQNKLDLVAKGNSKIEDLAALLFGEGSPVAPMAGALLNVKNEAELIRVNDAFTVGAKGNLLIAGLKTADVRAAFDAVENKKDEENEKAPEKRLNLKRRFNTNSFIFSHIDFDALKVIMPPKKDGITEKDYAAINQVFKAPLDIEYAFEDLADRFRVSIGVNIKECLAEKYAALLNNEPVKGGHIKLIGDRAPILAAGSVLNGEAVKIYPGFDKRWPEFLRALKSIGLTEEVFMNFLTGPVAITAGGSLAAFEGIKVPAVLIAKEGVKGAASEIVKAVAAKEKTHLMPVEAEGWDNLLQVDSSISPVSVLFGNNGETLYAGMIEKDALNKTPEIKTGQLAEILDKESLGSFLIDFQALQDYFKDDSTGVMAFASMMSPMAFGGRAEAIMAHLNELVNAKLSVPSAGFWTPDYGTCVIEFIHRDVPAEDGLLAKLIKFYEFIETSKAPANNESKKAE